MNSNKDQALELYQSLSALQPRYKELYSDLEKQYQSCQCYACKTRLVTFGIELVSLNSNVSFLEAQLLPSITSVLDKLTVIYTMYNDYIFILDNNNF